MEKIIYQGETFYYLNGRIYDGSFIEIPKIVSRPILNEYLKNVDYSGYGENELLKYIKELKIAELYSTCQTAVSFGLNKFTDSVDYYSTVFPIITSCYRKMYLRTKSTASTYISGVIFFAFPAATFKST